MGMALTMSKQPVSKRPTKMRTRKEKLGLRHTHASLKEIQRALKLGQKHAQQEEWAEAVKHLLVAWDAMPDDLSILTVLAHALAQLGVREHAVAVLERALQTHAPTADLIDIIQRLAMDMGMHDIAVKLGLQLVAIAPHDPKNYVNLATAYTGVNKWDESIDMLRAAIMSFPENADLWNVLATQVRERDGTDAADVFFEEAMRLNPRDYKVISNYSISFTRRNQFDKALELALRAIENNPDIPDPRIGAAQLMFMKGDMKNAWPHYEYRLSTRRKANQTQVYTHKLPIWSGENLMDKTLFVTAEQGIGDEVMWGSYLPFLYEQAAHLVIGCDPRLVSIYSRSFPNATVGGYADRISSGYRYRSFPGIERAMKAGDLHVDFAVPVGSAPSFAWHSREDIVAHESGYLKPCPDQVQTFVERMAQISSKPKIGIAWRSGLMSAARNYIYGSIEVLGPLFALSDQVDFVNLQYGDVAAEVALAHELHGVTLHQFEDVNLKADIEANLALMASCDLVISSCSAPGMFAVSSGVPTLFIAGSKPWWVFGEKTKVPFASNAEIFTSEGTVDWPDIVTRLTACVAERLELSSQ